MKNNRDKNLFCLVMIYVAVFISFCVLLGFCSSCSSIDTKIKKEIKNTTSKPRPTSLSIYIWNESDNKIDFFLIRGNGGALKTILVKPKKRYLLFLSQEGGYRYYFKAYDKNGDFWGEREGMFNIINGKLLKYKKKKAGFHIIIKDKNIKYRKSASRELFGNDEFVGEIKYGRRQDEMNLSNSRSRADIRFSGLPALLFEFFTQKNK